MYTPWSSRTAITWGVCIPQLLQQSYISNELVNLVSTDVVHSHHSVQGSIADRCVSVSYVDCNLLQWFCWCWLANIHSIAFNQTTQLLQTLWAQRRTTLTWYHQWKTEGLTDPTLSVHQNALPLNGHQQSGFYSIKCLIPKPTTWM